MYPWLIGILYNLVLPPLLNNIKSCISFLLPMLPFYFKSSHFPNTVRHFHFSYFMQSIFVNIYSQSLLERKLLLNKSSLSSALSRIIFSWISDCSSNIHLWTHIYLYSIPAERGWTAFALLPWSHLFALPLWNIKKQIS